MIFHNREISKTHIIAFLLRDCIEIDVSFEILRNLDAAILTSYAVEVRYPDDFYMPSVDECRQAIEIATKVRDFVSGKLAVPVCRDPDS